MRPYNISRYERTVRQNGNLLDKIAKGSNPFGQLVELRRPDGNELTI